MRKLIVEILFLKRGEQRALLVISILLFASLLLRVSVRRSSSEVQQPDTEFAVQIAKMRKELEFVNQKEYQQSIQSDQISPVLKPEIFDPNTITREDLALMGFPERALSNLMKYREAGGMIKRPEDLEKIYGMDSLSYRALFEFIVIEENSMKSGNLSERLATNSHHKGGGRPAFTTGGRHGDKYPEIKMNMELNNADSLDLIRIKGIGSVYSSRIIRYRDLLGGFYSLDQLWEIYGMDSLKYNELSASLFVDSSLIRRRNINEASFHSLVRHPYFTRKEVSDLINYRNFAGEIKDLAELKANQVIDSTGYEKMKHYLKCRINNF